MHSPNDTADTPPYRIAILNSKSLKRKIPTTGRSLDLPKKDS